MVAGKSISISGGEVSSVGVAIDRQILRACKSGLHGAFISDASQAAMLRELPVVDGMDQLDADPAPVRHFARARKTSRSSCMVASASNICRLNSGLYGVNR